MWSWISAFLAFSIGAFDGLRLLGNLRAGPAVLDHLDDGPKMAVGTLEALDDRTVLVVRHRIPCALETSSLGGIILGGGYPRSSPEDR
jgi:hypothetical protein